MKATRWLTDEQIEVIEAAHREEEAAISAARAKRRAAVAAVVAEARAGNLVARRPYLDGNESLFRLSVVEGDTLTLPNRGGIDLIVLFGNVRTCVALRDVFVKE